MHASRLEAIRAIYFDILHVEDAAIELRSSRSQGLELGRSLAVRERAKYRSSRPNLERAIRELNAVPLSRKIQTERPARILAGDFISASRRRGLTPSYLALK